MVAVPEMSDSAVAQSMLQSIVESLRDRPGDTTARRDARANEIVHCVLGFQPRDPVEIMFAGIAVTHIHLVMDASREVLVNQDYGLKTRAKSTVVAFDRGLKGILKELRLAQTRTIEATDATAAPAVTDRTSDPVRAAALTKPETGPARPPAPHGAPARPPEPPAAPARPPEPPAAPATVPPEPPETVLQPERHAETSVAAMMAVLSSRIIPRLAPTASATPVAAASLPRSGRPETAMAAASLGQASLTGIVPAGLSGGSLAALAAPREPIRPAAATG